MGYVLTLTVDTSITARNEEQAQERGQEVADALSDALSNMKQKWAKDLSEYANVDFRVSAA